MTDIMRQVPDRIAQGQIYRDTIFLESYHQAGHNIELSAIQFPFVVVLTQDCDLAQDKRFRRNGEQNDKLLVSVLVAPLYNAEHFFAGTHLSELGLTAELINKNRTPGEHIKKNLNPRYHYLEFPRHVPIVPSVVDFKHYFSVTVDYLTRHPNNAVVCLNLLYREDLSHRFAAFLSRIGLPDANETALADLRSPR